MYIQKENVSEISSQILETYCIYCNNEKRLINVLETLLFQLINIQFINIFYV